MDARSRLPAASALLAPYAVPIAGMLGRPVTEQEDPLRFPFQRDRGRIVHTEAFRRLKGKTQVFFGGGSDHYRTRLTHTLEVSGISRDLSRALQLNEDLAECIGLAHDLGHPPCGHAGEAALNAWLAQYESHFEHNLQSYRIVTVLEKHTAVLPGLNLNREVTDGLLKHKSPHDDPKTQGKHLFSLEAQVTNIADEITYAAHDCEDGLRVGLLKEEGLKSCALAARAYADCKVRGTSLRGALIGLLTADVYAQSERRLSDLQWNNAQAVLEEATAVIGFSDAMQKDIDQLHDYLMQNLYLHPQVLAKSQRGEEIIRDLCTAYRTQPTEKILTLQTQNASGLEQAVVDYVSGMTDQYLVQQAIVAGAAESHDLHLLDPQ